MSATKTLTIRGDAPLLMHAPNAVDPLSDYARRMATVTSKRKKSIDDIAELARIEWDSGLYYDDDLGPIVPVEMLEATIRDGAKLNRLGAEIKRSLVVTDDRIRLEYDGPRDRDGLYAGGFVDRRPAKVGQARVMRTRPMFRSWELTATLEVDTERMDPDTLRQVVGQAGRLVGVGDFRPRFGRFSVVELAG